jgi:hypothetical protein
LWGMRKPNKHYRVFRQPYFDPTCEAPTDWQPVGETVITNDPSALNGFIREYVELPPNEWSPWDHYEVREVEAWSS